MHMFNYSDPTDQIEDILGIDLALRRDNIQKKSKFYRYLNKKNNLKQDGERD